MVSLTQNQIAQYLFDYANLNQLMLDNPNLSIYSLFTDNMNSQNRTEDCNETYYNIMLRVYLLFLKMKTYSICEDYNLKGKNNFVNNNNLNLSAIRSSIIKEKKCNKSDKEILQLIRDAFCHSTRGNELYHISLNGKKIEFTLHRPDSITIDLKLDDIMTLTSSIFNTSQTMILMSLEWDNFKGDLKQFLKNIKIGRYYFEKKLDDAVLNHINNDSNNENHTTVISEVKKLKNSTTKQINLTENQIDNIINTVDELIENKIISKEEFNQYRSEILNILISKHLPLPFLKSENYTIDGFINYYLNSISSFSYYDICKIMILLPNKKEKEFSFEKYYDQVFNNIYDNLFFKLYYTNFNERMIHSHMLFIEYIIVNFCNTDGYIKIGKHNILYNKLRNSLVHSRWCIDKDKIVFYDASPTTSEEFNYNWSTSIRFVDLYGYCVNKFEEEKQDSNFNNDKSNKIKTIKFNA